MEDITHVRNSYGDYYLTANSDYNYVRYQQEKIVPLLEAVERGEIKRLMIFMPPGHAKSDLATRYFPAWYLGRHPDENIMICSYAATLATDDFGGKIKQVVMSDLHRSIFPQ